MISMTRGKIIFIDENGSYYQTLEFNGDMYPGGHGDTIIEKYEDGGIRSYNDYEKFAVSFDRRYFGYADSVEELISVSILENDSVDYTCSWTDYLYVINGSGRVVKAHTEDGIVEIPIAGMAVFHYQKLNWLVQIKERSNIVFSKKKFVATIARLQEIHDLRDNINKLIHSKSDLMDSDFLNGSGILISHEHSVIELLEFIMNDQAKNIEHYIYELDYGRTSRSKLTTDLYGNVIDYSSAGALYDYLLKEMEKNRNGKRAFQKIENGETSEAD